jgi:hypothetical protein
MKHLDKLKFVEYYIEKLECFSYEQMIEELHTYRFFNLENLCINSDDVKSRINSIFLSRYEKRLDDTCDEIISYSNETMSCSGKMCKKMCCKKDLHLNSLIKKLKYQIVEFDSTKIQKVINTELNQKILNILNKYVDNYNDEMKKYDKWYMKMFILVSYNMCLTSILLLSFWIPFLLYITHGVNHISLLILTIVFVIVFIIYEYFMIKLRKEYENITNFNKSVLSILNLLV